MSYNGYLGLRKKVVVLCTISIALLFISSATAVPQVNGSIAVEKIDKFAKIETIFRALSEKINNLLENNDKIMQRINLLLKQGGYFISLTPCLGEKKFLGTLSLLGHKIGILPYIRSFKINELEKSIADSNFHIVESKCLDNNPLEHFIIAKKSERT